MRKRGCFDLIEYFGEIVDSELESARLASNVNPGSIKSSSLTGEDLVKLRAGIDPADFEDQEVQQIIGVYNEEKNGLYGSESEEESQEEDSADDKDFVID